MLRMHSLLVAGDVFLHDELPSALVAFVRLLFVCLHVTLHSAALGAFVSADVTRSAALSTLRGLPDRCAFAFCGS